VVNRRLTLSLALLALASSLHAQSSFTSARDAIMVVEGPAAGHVPGALLIWHGDADWTRPRNQEDAERSRLAFRALERSAEDAGLSLNGMSRAYALVDPGHRGVTVEGQHYALAPTGDSVLVVMITVAANDAGRLVRTMWLPRVPPAEHKQWTSGDTTFTIVGPSAMDQLVAALKKTAEGAAFLK
jgi:hypothetical protein